MPLKPSTGTFALLAGAAASLSLLATASGAAAAMFTLSGTQQNVDAASGPSAARCGGGVTVTIGNGPQSSSTGMSNLGAFTTTQSHCLTPPLPGPYSLGQFEYDFAPGDALVGTYSGVLTFNAPGVFNNTQDFTITSGTGLFAGAAGSFNGTGLVSFLGPTPQAQLAFSGSFTTNGGVPEPTTWALMLSGFGLVGASLRGRRSRLPRSASPSADRPASRSAARRGNAVFEFHSRVYSQYKLRRERTATLAC